MHLLHQLQMQNFHGKGVATTDEDHLWISLFYSPRSPQGVTALSRFNEAARQLDKVMADAGDWPRRIPGHVCPAYAHRSIHLGVVNIDDMLANNDELAINMGISDLSPTFILLDGDNVPMKIDQHHIDELLEKGSDFWSERRCMHAFERLLAVISEERRERHAVQTDAVHALIVKTATPKGAFDSFISKYGDRRRLLRCAQHILHGSQYERLLGGEMMQHRTAGQAGRFADRHGSSSVVSPLDEAVEGRIDQATPGGRRLGFSARHLLSHKTVSLDYLSHRAYL